MQIFLKQIDLPVIYGIAYTRYRMLGPKPSCEQTAQHIQFIHRRACDNQIGMGNIRLLLYFYIRSVPCNAENIKLIQSFL